MLCGSAFETLLQPIVHLYWVDPPNRWSIHPKPRTASWHTKQAAACLRELERVQRTARLEGLHAAHRWLCAELQSEQRELARRAASLYDNEVADAWRVLQGIEKRAREALVAIPPAVRSTFVAVCAALCVLGCSSTTTGLGLYTETDGASDSAAEQRLDGQGADARSDAVADASAPDVRVPDATPDKLPAVDSASETAPVPDAAPDPCATCGCVGSSVACGRPSKPNCYGFDHDASCCSCPVGCPEPPGAWSACQQRDFDPPNVFWCCAP